VKELPVVNFRFPIAALIAKRDDFSTQLKIDNRQITVELN